MVTKKQKKKLTVQTSLPVGLNFTGKESPETTGPSSPGSGRKLSYPQRFLLAVIGVVFFALVMMFLLQSGSLRRDGGQGLPAPKVSLVNHWESFNVRLNTPVVENFFMTEQILPGRVCFHKGEYKDQCFSIETLEIIFASSENEPVEYWEMKFYEGVMRFWPKVDANLKQIRLYVQGEEALPNGTAIQNLLNAYLYQEILTWKVEIGNEEGLFASGQRAVEARQNNTSPVLVELQAE